MLNTFTFMICFIIYQINICLLWNEYVDPFWSDICVDIFVIKSQVEIVLCLMQKPCPHLTTTQLNKDPLMAYWRIITARQRSCVKVMLLVMSVCRFTGVAMWPQSEMSLVSHRSHAPSLWDMFKLIKLVYLWTPSLDPASHHPIPIGTC